MIKLPGPVSRAWAWVRRPWTLTADCRHSLHTHYQHNNTHSHSCPLHSSGQLNIQSRGNKRQQLHQGDQGWWLMISVMTHWHIHHLDTLWLSEEFNSKVYSFLLPSFLHQHLRSFTSSSTSSLTTSIYTSKPSTAAASIAPGPLLCLCWNLLGLVTSSENKAVLKSTGTTRVRPWWRPTWLAPTLGIYSAIHYTLPARSSC